jgi:hypothetical protein
VEVVVGAIVVVNCFFVVDEDGFVPATLAGVESFFDTTAYAPAAEPSTMTTSSEIQRVRRRTTPRSSERRAARESPPEVWSGGATAVDASCTLARASHHQSSCDAG